MGQREAVGGTREKTKPREVPIPRSSGTPLSDMVVEETEYGQSSTSGEKNTSARGDHDHGTPPHPYGVVMGYPALQLTKSIPPQNMCKVINFYVNPQTDKLIIEYDDTPQP